MFRRGVGFGDDANSPEETPQWVSDAVKKKKE
jgi:hypothetical protein